MGWQPGLVVLLGDTLKGVLAVLLARWIGGGPVVQALAGLAAVAGHDWPVWLRFRGGRGVATSLGATAVLAPVPAGIAVGLFVGTVALTRYVSLGSMIGAASVPLVLIAPAISGQAPLPVLGFAGIASSLIIWQHRPNIRRLREGRENKFSLSSRRAGSPKP